MSETLLAIRPFREPDRSAVVALWHACGLMVPWNDADRDIDLKLGIQPDLLLVAERDGRVVGTVMAGWEGHRGWINYLAVEPALRRQGIGRELMAEAERRLAGLGCPKINLQIRAHNTGVVRFYEALGYEVGDLVSMGKLLRGPD